MSEEQIREVIGAVLSEMGIENPTAKDKGAIMKVLMPRVKGKADGRLVNGRWLPYPVRTPRGFCRSRSTPVWCAEQQAGQSSRPDGAA